MVSLVPSRLVQFSAGVLLLSVYLYQRKTAFNTLNAANTSLVTSRVKPKKKEHLRIATYNIRAFFDRYDERWPFLLETIRLLKPDVIGMQEAMINGAGQDGEIAAYLSHHHENSYSAYSVPSILCHLEQYGTPYHFDKVTAVVLRSIIYMHLFSMKIPLLGYYASRIALYMEYIREIIHNRYDIDILAYYYVFYATIYGNSLLVGNDVRGYAHEYRALEETGDHMGTVHRVLCDVKVNGGKDVRTIMVVNLHLSASIADDGNLVREGEIHVVMSWIKPEMDKYDGVIIIGDHNTLHKDEIIYKSFEQNGFQSAYKLHHGSEPSFTWPTGIQAKFIDVEGIETWPNGVTLDYIWIYSKENRIQVKFADLAGDESHHNDTTLYPSDHFAIYADLLIT